jgi:hypothetical protein
MNLAPLDSSRQAASFERKIFENLKKYFLCEFRKNFYLKRSSLTRGIQRCKIHCRSLLNNGAMAVLNFEISNGHNSVIKRLKAMNLAPLDSSRQAASFERKIFEN